MDAPLPKPSNIQHREGIHRESRCPEATPSRKGNAQTPSAHVAILNAPRAQMLNKDKYQACLSPVGGLTFFYALGLEQEPEDEIIPMSQTKKTSYATLERSPQRNNRNRSSLPKRDGSTLFKGSKRRSDNARGIMRFLWLFVEWLGRIIAHIISPSSGPVSTRKVKKFNAKNHFRGKVNPRTPTTPEQERLSHLRFTPMVHRPHIPM